MGAGDAFNAAYIASCLLGKNVDEALAFAVHCGRAVATSTGDTTAFPRNLQLRV
jgi:sugar/nucleoside kinase (ribokinase family)